MENIFYPFSLPIYKKLIKKENYIKIKEDVDNFIKDKKEFFEYPEGWKCNTLSTINIPPNNNLKSLILNKTIQHSVEEYCNVWGFKNTLDLSIYEIWVNLSHQGSYQEVHNHTPALFSGVLYIETDKNSGDICFLNPLKIEGSLMGDQNLLNYKQTITPQNGLLLLFPGWLSHSVFINESNNKRISVSFNIIKN